MSVQKLARGLLEIPKGMSTAFGENSAFMNNLERTNTLLVQFLSSSDDKRMIMRTELEESYFNLTIYNLKESIKHKIEQDMWNNLFKKHISDLQTKMKSRDKIEATKAQSELSLFLDEAIGFYSKFLDILSLIHNIRLPGRQMSKDKSLCKERHFGDDIGEPDIYYIVQHCFVHIGDLSRYHNLHKLARLNYQLAVELNPSSGHAYNQLAILESSSMTQILNHTNFNRLLSTILYYDFASTCTNPFPASRINLDSLLRRIHQESVSELLTSNTKIDDASNCLSSLSVAWLHSYASMRLYNNIQRCRQLQQRIVEWATEIVKHYQVSIQNWRELVTICALQCGLLSIYDPSKESADVNTWNYNLQQFTQDFINAICYGLVSISHDEDIFSTLLNETSCFSVIMVYMTWLNQYMVNQTENKAYLTIPFGEQFVKLINILRQKVDPVSLFGNGTMQLELPVDLPELHFLSGYEPLKVPCKKFDLFSQPEPSQLSASDKESGLRRGSFIVQVALRMAEQHSSLLTYNVISGQFVRVYVVNIPEEVTTTTTAPSIKKPYFSKRPVNVALSSFISSSNTRESLVSNNSCQVDKKCKPAMIKVATPPSDRGHVETLSDVKLAKCIQEHIALETTHSLLPPPTDILLVSTISPGKDESRSMAPAPGLILSSNLPADYKTMTTVGISDVDELRGPSQEPAEKSSSPPPSSNAKLHSYNPNREQFEKDLPPRFANKRSGSQKESKSGFKSLNYWDSTNITSNCETNLAKKESEMMMPPMIPSSWLSDNQENNQRNMHMSPLHAQMTDMLNQQRKSFNNELPQNSMTMFQPSFHQFQKPTMTSDQDSKMLQYLTQSTPSNPNNFSYQSSQQDMMDPSHLKLGHMFMSPPSTVHGMQHNFPPIPPPPQQNHLSNMGPRSHMPQSTTLNYDQFTMGNCYDKPTFSTSNQSGFGYTSSSIMSQQNPSPQQQQKYNHQLRSNNPLLNLLPGFMNEMQR